jgi:hypothetical protein
MSATRSRHEAQLAVVRGAWGAVLLADPGRVIAVVPGARRAQPERVIARVLGARHVLQASAALAGSEIARRAWWVDALHCASMVALAIALPTDRRLAGADATIAAAFAIATRASYSG